MTSDPSHPASEAEVAPRAEAEEPVEDFAVLYARDARPGMNRLELTVLIVGLGTTALSLLWGELSVTLGWLCGWLVGQANVAVMRQLIYRVFASGFGSRVGVVVLVAKMLALMVVVGVVLNVFPVSPEAFAGGFTATLIGLVVGSVIVAARRSGAAPGAGAAPSSVEGGEGGSAAADEQDTGTGGAADADRLRASLAG